MNTEKSLRARLTGFAAADRVGGLPIPNSVRAAAYYALAFMDPIRTRERDDVRLMKAVLGDFNDLPYEVYEQHARDLRSRGALGWNPEEELLQASWTPFVGDWMSCPQGRHNRFLARTVMFCEQWARPLVVATLHCLARSHEKRVWDLRSLTIFLINEEGDDFDRPFFISPTRNIGVAP